MRLNKFISNSGYCSRRQADELIAQGKVLLNRQVVQRLGTQVDPQKDEVRVKGGPVLNLDQESILILLNKPKGYTSTKKDPYANRTVYELLPKKYQHLMTIGRLDKDSEGLLLFTNNGDLAQQMAHPKHGKEKVYQVTIRGRLNEKDFKKIEKGMRLREYRVAPAKARELEYAPGKDRSTLEVILGEGKNRQIRNMFLALKHPVKQLVRLSVGKYRLGKLKPGEWKLVKHKI